MVPFVKETHTHTIFVTLRVYKMHAQGSEKASCCAAEEGEIRREQRADAGVRRGRAAAAFVAFFAILACCKVLTAHDDGKPLVLDEGAALAIAESYFPPSASNEKLKQIQKPVSQWHDALSMAESYFHHSVPKEELTQVPGASEAPVWPGLADFERHEAAVKAPGLADFERHEAVLKAAKEDKQGKTLNAQIQNMYKKAQRSEIKLLAWLNSEKGQHAAVRQKEKLLTDEVPATEAAQPQDKTFASLVGKYDKVLGIQPPDLAKAKSLEAVTHVSLRERASADDDVLDSKQDLDNGVDKQSEAAAAALLATLFVDKLKLDSVSDSPLPPPAVPPPAAAVLADNKQQDQDEGKQQAEHDAVVMQARKDWSETHPDQDAKVVELKKHLWPQATTDATDASGAQDQVHTHTHTHINIYYIYILMCVVNTTHSLTLTHIHIIFVLSGACEWPALAVKRQAKSSKV